MGRMRNDVLNDLLGEDGKEFSIEFSTKVESSLLPAESAALSECSSIADSHQFFIEGDGDRLRFDHTLFGRDHEIERLKNAYLRVADGNASTCFIHGER